MLGILLFQSAVEEKLMYFFLERDIKKTKTKRNKS